MLLRKLATTVEEPALLQLIRNPAFKRYSATPSQLLTYFNDNEPIHLQLDILLRNGILLTSSEATQTRESFIDFLLLQGLPNLYSNRNRSSAVDKISFVMACKVVDYLLLNDSRGAISKFGLSAASASDLIGLLVKVASGPDSSSEIYSWYARLTDFVREGVASVDETTLERLLTETPELAVLPPVDERETSLSDAEIIKARAYLLLKGRELRGPHAVWDLRTGVATLNSVRDQLYRDTLLGRCGYLKTLRFPAELDYPNRNESWRRELTAVPVSIAYEDDRVVTSKVERYRACILSASTLSPFGNCFTEDVLEAVASADISDAVEMKNPGGFRHVPPHIVFASLKRAIDFFYTHHEHILASTVKVLKSGGPKSFDVASLHPKTKEMGVTTWNLSKAGNLTNYAQRVRAGELGLWDALQLLYGAIALCVGLCEALRSGELTDLRAEDLHETQTYLLLMSRKSGPGDFRRQDEIPIPKVAADMLSALNRFQIQLGFENKKLFAAIGVQGRLTQSAAYIETCIDCFLDFIQSGTDDLGRRYYLRQHQLRKFFVQAFFACAGFAAMDTLRWFLRHLDIKHLWAYIKLTTSTSELRMHMAAAAVSQVRAAQSHMRELTVLLKRRFGVTDLSVVSDAEMQQLIEDAERDHSIKLELVFPDNATFYVGAVVWEQAA